MVNNERLKARVTVMASGSNGWVGEAEEQDLDDEAVEEVRQATEHARAALAILSDDGDGQ
ncbi:hypothetical protein [Halobacterium hubeiense]|uniref:hypothetical protein n=1 Tax=Halobacterium hubeiense TaxID=1407499 RepID=UPI003C75EFD3